MTNGSAQLLLSALTPAPDQTKCTGAFTGSAGSGACGLILAVTPADNPLKANTSYSGIVLGCVVACGSGNTCPASMTGAGTGNNCICIPN